LVKTVGGWCHKVTDALTRNFQEERLIIAEEFNSGNEKIVNIPYLIIVCTILLVSGAISVGSTDIIGKVGVKTSITDSREGIGRQIDNETTHRQVRPHRALISDAANQTSENGPTSMESDDKGQSVQPRRLHAGRVHLTLFSLWLISMKPLGHA
jgi:hypothetical protein